MAKFNLTCSKTVAELKKEFNDTFGSRLKVYQGGSIAADDVVLSELGLKANSTLECRSSLTAGSFITRIADFGLKVSIWTQDYHVKVLDGLTLESTGKVKNMARKKDMEDMIAYQRKEDSAAEDSPNNNEGGNILYTEIPYDKGELLRHIELDPDDESEYINNSMMRLINHTNDEEWEHVHTIDTARDGLYVTDIEFYEFTIVLNGEIVFGWG